MKFSRSLLFVCPAACLLAQTPAPAPKPGAPPQPTVTLSAVNPPENAIPAVPPDRVVVAVGDVKVTAGQFEQIVSSLPSQYQAAARGAGRKQFADNLVRILVLAEEGKRRKLDESDAYKLQTKFQAANILAAMTYDQISKDTKLDEAELRKYYDAHKSDFEEAKARHILIRMNGSPLPVKPGQKDLTEAEALAKAQELRKKIEEGQDFAKVATQESDDTGSGANGGELGYFRHNQMVPAFDEAAFAMKPGELSQPVKTQFGFHLIQMEDKKTKSFEEARPDLERRMRPELAQKKLEEIQKASGVQLDPEFFGTAKSETPKPDTPKSDAPKSGK